jgi:hypothetical protein
MASETPKHNCHCGTLRGEFQGSTWYFANRESSSFGFETMVSICIFSFVPHPFYCCLLFRG